jgi:hypothetical protein
MSDTRLYVEKESSQFLVTSVIRDEISLANIAPPLWISLAFKWNRVFRNVSNCWPYIGRVAFFEPTYSQGIDVNDLSFTWLMTMQWWFIMRNKTSKCIYHHHRLYSPGWALASSWGFVTIFFYGVGLLASRPTPNLEGQGIPFCLGHHPWPVWHGRPYQ